MADVNLLGEPVNIAISRDQDWNQAHWLVEGTRPFDLTDCTVELWIRPAFDHATLIRTLSSDEDAEDGGGEIVIDDALTGAFHIYVAQADVEANITASPDGGWVQFLRVITGSGTVIEWWRGTLAVRAGSLAT